MKKVVSIILALSLFPSYAFADCDWSLITPGPNKTFVYPELCHQQVGIMKQSNMDLQKALDAEKDATKQADIRAENWMNTSLKLEDQFQKVDTLQKSNDKLYFGLGALTVILTGFLVASLTHRN